MNPLSLSGRAGRVSKGYCYRLVTKEFWRNEIPDYVVPEMVVRESNIRSAMMAKNQAHNYDRQYDV